MLDFCYSITSIARPMYVLSPILYFFFFKQQTAYEVRISDWSSDVCSSDLHRRVVAAGKTVTDLRQAMLGQLLGQRHGDLPGSRQRSRAALRQQVDDTQLKVVCHGLLDVGDRDRLLLCPQQIAPDRKSVVSGKGVSVSVALGGRRFIK